MNPSLLGQCLKGSAADYYGDLPEETRNDYTELIRDMRSMYSTQDTRGHLQMELNALNQKDGQNLVKYAEEVHHLAQQAYKGQRELAGVAAAQNFLRGLRNKDAARWAMEKEPN